MLTPYQFASNNPIMLIDIDGLEGGLPAGVVEEGEKIKQAVVSFFSVFDSALNNAMQTLGSLFSQEESTKQVDATPSSSSTKPPKEKKEPSEVKAEKVLKKPINEPKVSTGDMISPVKDPYVTSEKSEARKHPKTGKVKPHNGIDIVARTREATSGTPVVAPADGKVQVKTKEDGNGAGNRVHLVDKKGNKHSFFHLQDGMNVKSGQNVNQGDTIGRIGTTGTSTAAHLHYEVRDESGNILNPREANPGLKSAPNR